MRLKPLIRQLSDAENFVELGVVACDFAEHLLDCSHGMAVLFTDQQRFALMLDNVVANSDTAVRMHYLHNADIDPVLALALETHAVSSNDQVDSEADMRAKRAAGYQGEQTYDLCLPLLGPYGVVGYTRHGRFEPMSRALKRDLVVVANYVAAHLGRLGINAIETRPLQALSDRQYQIASLAVKGLTNSEIAEVVECSPHAVKKHLRIIFERLDVSNRTELAWQLARASPQDPYPRGITRIDRYYIAKLSRTEMIHA